MHPNIIIHNYVFVPVVQLENAPQCNDPFHPLSVWALENGWLPVKTLSWLYWLIENSGNVSDVPRRYRFGRYRLSLPFNDTTRLSSIGPKNKSFRDSSLPNTPLHQLTLDPRTPFNHYSCQEGERHEEKRRDKRRDRESIESSLMTSQTDHAH